MHLSKNLTEAGLEKFPLVPTAPFISLNSSIEAKERPRVYHRRRKRRSKIDDGPKVVPPPPCRTVSPRLQRHLRSLSLDEALLYAKKEIEHAPLVDNDDDSYLYAPVFRNVSIFQRGYELMEIILEVYIYPDGERPIFHEPHLNGIYASEGWFMKFLEANREFVTKDPEKAHLFFLPYSSRQLELALYVPNSHNLRPLSIFLRDYVNMIASKYPFWNRTHGSDHFLVACHDWGPYITTAHKELRNNSIKAVRNADLSENFIAGKDVSLPETAIRHVGRPLRYIGSGNRVSQCPILAFFAGNIHGRVRPKLLKYWHNKDEDMKIYGPLPIRVSRNMTYIQHMKSSKYCICSMGYEVNSPRIVEAIYYECVPAEPDPILASFSVGEHFAKKIDSSKGPKLVTRQASVDRIQRLSCRSDKDCNRIFITLGESSSMKCKASSKRMAKKQNIKKEHLREQGVLVFALAVH
ncbi:hypothetical protein CRYUN_Cryun19dG0144900 [Craigia yunnanensis]